MSKRDNNFRQYDLIIKSVEQASRNISKILNIIDSPVFSIAIEKQVQWINNIKPFLNAYNNLPDISQAFRKQFEEIEYMSKLSQKAFESLEIKQYINKINFSLPDLNILNNLLFQMSSSYSNLWETIEENLISIIDKSPIIIQQPPIDFYHASLLSCFISNEYYEVDDKEKSLLEDRHQNINGFLYKILPQIDPELINLYRGAIDALLSDNPDKQRHFTVSLRELFTKILHTLSPDDKFIEWNSHPNNLKDGRPTRRGRLLYIYRNINLPPFNQFIEKDIAAALSFIDLYQEGTHNIKGPFNREQSWAILYRMECIIYFLIKANKLN